MAVDDVGSLFSCTLLVTLPRGGVQSIAMHLSVCLFICLYVYVLACLENQKFRLNSIFMHVGCGHG